MTLKLLLVEDSEHKRVRVLELLSEIARDAYVDVSCSFNSGSRAIESADYDLAIIDMSLPTHDRSPTDSGGRFRSLGGRELARKLLRRNRKTKVVFLTQYDAFSDSRAHTLRTLEVMLREDCGDNFAALIYYNSSQSLWKEQLAQVFFEL